MRRSVAVSLLLAGASLVVVLPAPSYDPWSWLRWGDELLAGQLSTLEGPSFKPLPVALCALLAPFGPAAPALWVLLARAAAVFGVLLAGRAGHRLAGGSLPAGILAALGVALCGPYLELAAEGASEGMALALVLAGVEAWCSGHSRWALAWGVAAGLVRVETWPFLLAAGVLAWRRQPENRPLLVAGALLIPVAWVLPELVGSGEALRSATRALVPNPGQPALSDTPVLASLHAALSLPLLPLWAGVAFAVWSAWRWDDRVARNLLAPAAVGLAWIGVVAAMAGAGFSGEPRYALVGAALIGVSGAAGLVVSAPRVLRSPGIATGVATALVAAAIFPRAGRVIDLRQAQAHQWRLQGDLAVAVEQVGGADAVLACGRPYVGSLRGPLLAHHLQLAKYRVEPDQAPESPGVVFRSALHRGEAPTPAVPAGFRPVAGVGSWRVFADCAGSPSASLDVEIVD
jgi:uncharacterized protein YoaH (UPF0181 family)